MLIKSYNNYDINWQFRVGDTLVENNIIGELIKLNSLFLALIYLFTYSTYIDITL